MDTDLFQSGDHNRDVEGTPLAWRMRPTSLDEFVGQEHLVQEGTLLRNMMESDRLSSLILYGPPGTGKTSLAHVIAQVSQGHFETINAVSSGVAEIRKQIDRAAVRLAKHQQRTILFIDEIHRLNKAQQDVLLPDVEGGRIVLIGTTVENPFFYIISPLLSRSHIFELKPLSDDNLRRIGQRVLADEERGLGRLKITIQDEALQMLVDQSEGDARRFLNIMESVVMSTPPGEDGTVLITRDVAEGSMPNRIHRHDRNGDHHYDVVSAFIKSMRGSDPDASLYWLARMISAGEDPRYIARRIIICAAEDVGNADPQALVVACAAHTAAQCVGLPEARIPLAQAALYVATAPKSNACYVGITEAMEDVHSGKRIEVPLPLRSSGFPGAKRLNRGEGYAYPHDDPRGYVDQDYIPGRRAYYRPGSHGYEAVIQQRLKQIRESSHKTKTTVKENRT